ncbi:hypothetical protein ZIOFF_027166 [Zingiber officinale]|uniref:L-ascorbate oxidase n=2 Tax=Zingiber officinale TaxID=94328 RepID=A0A8J5LL15_ZINOF|nr:hypothetical protein ZIOFF_027166 [Zingiber officinale]
MIKKKGRRRMWNSVVVLLIAAALFLAVGAEDPYLYFTWKVSYGTAAPLGVPQRVILVDGQFPGPNINSTTNNNIVINVFNELDEPFLFSWNGIQQRKNSWQDGVAGTNCPIQPGKNFTYHFQVKDQIGSFYYFPSLGMQKAVGGFGGLRVNSRLLIPVPFDPPADDFTVLINDWYAKDHKSLANALDGGRGIGVPVGVLINGKNRGDSPLFTMEAGKVYRYRVCNTGTKASLNFRIQGHVLKLVEMEGSHTVQNAYASLDLHLGQCLSVLVEADQAPADYYVVASSRFLKKELTATAIVRYAGSNGAPPAPEALPKAPVGWAWSLNQWRSFRWNLTASAARPNPQGSYHYGSIDIARTIRLSSSRAAAATSKKRFALNGVSHVDSATPLKLAEYFSVDGVFKYNLIGDVPPPPASSPITLAPNVIKIEHRSFVEIILENPEKSMQAYHLDGYAFFLVGMGPGKWSEASRKHYNLMDAVSKHSVQVFPGSWSAIMASFDNVGMWNLRSEVWERRYLGQQLYISIGNLEESLRDEYNVPENAIICGGAVGRPLPALYT